MCQRKNVFFATLVLFSLLRVSLSAQAYSPDGVLQNQLEAKIIVIRLSASLTLRESLLQQREADWTVRNAELTTRDAQLSTRENGLNEKEADLNKRETSIEATEKTFSDLKTSLTTVSKKYALAKKALWIVGALAALEAVVLVIK